MPRGPAAHYETVASASATSTAAVKGKMFGMPTLMVGGKAFAGLFKDAMVFKLRGKDHERALALAGARLFDPSGRGRPMKEWVEVPARHAARWASLARQALKYVSESR